MDHVLAANQLIEKMTGHVRWLARDRLKLIDSHANALLVQAIKNLPSPRQEHAYSFALRSADPVVAHVVPTTGQARELFGGLLSWC